MLRLRPINPIIGGNAFTHESGIHTHGLLTNTETYEPFPPENVGRRRRIVFGKHTGRSSVILALDELGIEATDDQINEIVRRVKELGDKGKRITDADFEAIVETVMDNISEPKVELVEATFVSGNNVTSTASVRLRINGEDVLQSGVGDGPVDAAFSAICSCLSEFAEFADIELGDYHVDAVTGGTNALIEVRVEFSKNGKTKTARGAGTDVVMASVEAILEDINCLVK